MTRNDDTSPAPRIGLEWLGIRQATEYACVSERTLRSWIHSPVEPLPAVTVDLDAIVNDALRGVSHGRKGSKAQGPQVLVRGH